MATQLTGFVSDYLYEQRIRQDSVSVEKLAATIAPLFQSASGDALNEQLTSSSAEMGGRLLVLDADGKVQFDSYSRMQGHRLELPEVLAILTGGQSSAYGVHRLSAQDELDDSDYVAYCASQLTGTRGVLGVLLYVSTVS